MKRTDKARLDWLFKSDAIFLRNKWPKGTQGYHNKTHQLCVEPYGSVTNGKTYRQAIDAAMDAESRARKK